MKHHKPDSASHTSLSRTTKTTALPQILADYLGLLIFLWLQTISWSFGWKRITSLIEFEADFTQSASYTEFIKSERCPDVRFHNTGCVMSPNIGNTGILLANNSERESDVVMWPYSFIVQTRSESAKTKQAANSWLSSVSALMQDLPHPHCSASCNREISTHLLLWQLFTLFIF